MNIKKPFKEEEKDFKRKWEEKRKAGFLNYLLFGFVRTALFLMCTYMLKFLIEQKLNFTWQSLLSIFVCSALLPLLSWSINEWRLRKCNNSMVK